MLACNPGTLCTPTEGKGLSTSLQPLLLCPAPSPRNHRWDSPHYTTTNYSSPSVRDFHWGSFILGTSIPEDPGHHFPHWDALGAGMGKLCELGRVCEVLSSQLWDWGFSSSGDGPGKRLTVPSEAWFPHSPILRNRLSIAQSHHAFVTIVLNWLSAAPQLSRRVPREGWLAA